MGVLEILGIILGSGGLSSFITWMVHLNAHKRLKDAEAAQSEVVVENLQNANKKDKFESMYVQITKMMHDYNELSDDYRAYR